jgi:uncharacterized protein (TIGR03067 family)
MKKSLLGVVACVLLLGSDNPRGDQDAATTMDGLRGTWTLQGATLNGEEFRGEKRGGQSFHFRADTVVWRVGRRETTWLYTADDRQNPPHLTLEVMSVAPAQGEQFQMLYRVEGDVLRVCWSGIDFRTRPKSFTDYTVYVLTFKRGKP